MVEIKLKKIVIISCGNSGNEGKKMIAIRCRNSGNKIKDFNFYK